MRPVKDIVEEAFAYHRDADLDKAAYIYDRLLAQLTEPDPNLFYGYGSLLVERESYGLGLLLLGHSAKIYPNYAPTWTNMAVAYKFLGMDEHALAAWKKADGLSPNDPQVLAGLAGYWLNRDESAKAEMLARQVVEKYPTEPASNMHLAIALLEQGRFSEAWQHFEYRWESLERKKNKRPYKAPMWDGSPVDVLAIHGEQGLGDEILFMSCFREAQKRARRVVIECASRLVPLFKDSFNVPCYPTHDDLIAVQGEPSAYISMGSLPRIVGLPDGKAFLRRPMCFRRSDKPTIGIAWRGGMERTNQSDRSLGLADLVPILNAIDADFVSVQYGNKEIEREAQQAALRTTERDFDTLNRTIAGCDLVISVCQTAVHVAGGMGIPCWVLTPRKAAWRYCLDDMRPWYESVRLFRQKNAGDWSDVVQSVADEVKALAWLEAAA